MASETKLSDRVREVYRWRLLDERGERKHAKRSRKPFDASLHDMRADIYARHAADLNEAADFIALHEGEPNGDS